MNSIKFKQKNQGYRKKVSFPHLLGCSIFKRNFFVLNDNGKLPKFYATVARSISLEVSYYI